MKKNFAIFLILVFCGQAMAQKPGDAGVLFLLIQPSVRANGMGGASVVSAENGGMAVAFNPAHLSMPADNHYLNFEFYPTKTKWLPQLASNLRYEAKSIHLSYDLRRLNKNIPLKLGAGFTRVFIDLGEQIITGEYDPTPIGWFRSSERANVWSIGAGWDYFIKAGFGMSFKNIESNLTPPPHSSIAQYLPAAAHAHDFGMVVYMPLFDIIPSLKRRSFGTNAAFRPFATAGLGYSQSNIGGKITYTKASPGDPLPRVARAGLSLNAGLALNKNDLPLKLFSFERINESEQLLVRRKQQGHISYAGLLGDINFGKNVILGKSGSKIITKKGWELNLLELVSIRGGRYADPLGKVHYDTDGLGLHLSGAFKIFVHMYPELNRSSVWKFLSRHLDLAYNSSAFSAAAGHPLGETDFHGISISF